MSVAYRAVNWNRHKRIYDGVIALGVVGYIAAFYGAGRLAFPRATDETLLIRALGTCAFVMLTVVLCIGPLARLDTRLSPLLYNRRHLGVATFVVALAHAAFTIFQYHAMGDVNPLVSLLASNTSYGSLPDFPFETLGLVALVILFLMAATSHDFWLANVSPRWWKTLHMCVYGAYALLVMHVALGFLQQETSPLYAWLLGASVACVVGLHLAAGLRQRGRDRAARAEPAGADGLVDAGPALDIPPDRARLVCAAGESIAVFRHGEGGRRLSAISNVCAHQGGPLAEGKVVDGCITCPWHGYQYLPETGQSPPPFTEKLKTYRVRVERGRVLIDPRPNPPGTRVEPATIEHPEGAPTP